MKWTTKAPVKPGWYWWRRPGLKRRMAHVYTTGDVKQNGSDVNPFVQIYNDDGSIPSGGRVRDTHGEWYPVPDPD